MKVKNVGLVASIIAIVLMTSSCSKVPQQEIDSANAAIEAAKAAGADVYVPEAFLAVQDSLNVALENIETQKSKMFKNFDDAKANLAQVVVLANQAKDQVDVRKNEIKNEIQNLQTEIKTLLDENKQLVTKAPKGKEGASALTAIKDEISSIETSVGEINTLLENGNLMDSLVKAKAAKEKAASINQELKDVIAKYKARKP